MSWFGDLFGGNNPADEAMPYLDRIPGATQNYMNPYFESGTRALSGLEDQYKNLLGNPGDVLNKIGEGYKESPGLKFAIQQALGASGRGQAAGGMAGSPQHEQQNMQLASDISSQDYNNWLGRATGLYGQGLSGQQDLSHMGQQAGQSLSDTIAQTLAQQGNLEFQGGRQQNQNRNDLWGNIIGGVGSLAAFNPWGIFGKI